MNRSIHDSRMPKVEIYTWEFCPFCIRAKTLLNQKGIKFTEYSIDGDLEARKKKSEKSEGRNTVPQIFINDKSIGGCDELYVLEEKKQLNELLEIKD